MKVRVIYGIDYLKREVWKEYPNMIDCIIDWNYPVLPREGETIDNFECLIPNEIKDNLSRRTCEEFFVDEFWPLLPKEKKKEISVFDFLSEVVCKIERISWQWIEDSIIPCIYIAPKY